MADVKLYTLSTCGHCRKTKKLLDDCNCEYECTEVDLLKGKEREQAIEEVKKCNPKLSFPTIVIGDTTIVGFREDDIREAIEK